ASASGQAAGAGALVSNTLLGDINAEIAQGADVRALNNVGVSALDRRATHTLGGSAAFSLCGVGGGLSAAVTVLDTEVTAGILGQHTRVTALGLGEGLQVYTGQTANSKAIAEALKTEDGASDSADGPASDSDTDRFAEQQKALADVLTDFSFEPETKTVHGVSVNSMALQKAETLGASVALSVDPYGGAANANIATNVFGGKTRAL